MATSKKTIKKEVAKQPEGVVVNQIIIRPVDRSEKDIADWRAAHRHAEAVVNAQRSRLYDLYSDIDLDGHLTGITQKRVDAVLNKKLHFERNGKKVDEMDTVIKTTAFRRILDLLVRRKFWGISGMEFVPGDKLQVVEIPRKHIKPQLKIISKEQSGETGWNYEEMPNLWVVGDPNDLGLYLKCAPYVLWKRGNMADWAQYVEIFGQPIRVIKYDSFDLKTKMELTTVLDESGSSLSLMIPKQADFEIMDGKASNANGELQERLKIACNDEMSVIILGNTETTTSSKSSGYAQAAEHSKQQLEVNKSDLEDVENLLNSEQFLAILKSYNLPVEGGNFTFEGEVDLNELKTKKDIDLALSAKIPIADDYFYETYNIPKPENYEELKAKMDEERMAKLKPPAAMPTAGAAHRKKLKQLRALSGVDPFEIEEDDEPIVQKIKAACRNFINKLSFFD